MNSIHPAKNYKWEVLVLLWLAFFLNQADRQIFNVVLPLIKADLQLTDAQVGAIASIFIAVFAIMVPVAGYISDFFSKKWICTLSLLFWSAATALTGLSTTVVHLIFFRSVTTGGGEAFYAPANYALLADYHQKTRSFAMAIHQTSLYVGVITTGFLAAYIGENWGWQYAFYVFGLMGVVLGIVMSMRLKDYPKAVGIDTKKKENPFKNIGAIFKTPTALLLTVAFAGLVVINVGYLTWMPTFLHEKFDLSLTSAGFSSMFYTHIFAFIGVIIAGKLTDRWVQKDPAARLKMQIAGMMAMIPFIYMMGAADSLWVTYIGLAGFGFFRGLYEANIYASLYDVISPDLRGSASGIMIMFAFLTGAASPLILGLIKPTIGLSVGVSSLSVAALVAGLAIFIAMKFYFKNDYWKETVVSN